MSQYVMETEEDMAAYLDINFGHGVEAVWTNSGTATTINIILNNEYIEQEGLDVSVEATQPIAYCRSIDVPSIAHGNTLKAAQTYTVVSIQSDRTGFTALELEEV